MKKRFIYLFIITWGIIAVSFYNKYLNIKEKNSIIKNNNTIYKFDLAKELLHSELKNIYFQDFNSFKIKEILSKKPTNYKKDLEIIIKEKFYKYNNILKDITYYNLKGEIIFSTNLAKNNKLDFHSLDTVKLKFEYINSKNKNFINILPIIFKSSTIGYIKQEVTLENFMEKFFKNTKYIFLKSNKKLNQDIYPLNINTFHSNKFFGIKIKDNNIETYLINQLLTELILSAIIFLIITYTLYRSFFNEKILKDRISQQKEFFEKIIEASPNPIFVKDKDKKYILANNATSNMLNINRNDFIIDKSNNELFKNKKYIHSINSAEDHSLMNNQTVCVEIQKIETNYYKLTFIPIKTFKYPKKENMILGFATDITSEVKKKNELDRNNSKLKIEVLNEMSNRMKINEKFKKIFDNINDAMFVSKINKDGTLSEFLDINTAGVKFLKCLKYEDEIDPNKIFKNFKFSYNNTTNDIEILKDSYIDTIEQNQKINHIKVSCHIVFVKDRYNAIFFVQNIDEIIKLKKERKEQQALISNIFKQASAGIAVIDKNGKFIKYNQSFYKMLGYTKTEFKEKDFYNLFENDKIEDIKQEHNEIFNNTKDISQEHTFITKDNSIINIISSSTLIKDENDKILRLFIVENITKQKQLEDEHKQNSKIIVQQSKMAEMGEMIGAIAHQWRQPLNAINAAAIKLSFSSSLDMLENNEIQEKTKFIEEQSVKMSETINDFMNFFSPSKNKELFLINTIYKKIFSFLEPQLKNRDIKLTIHTNNEIELYGFKNEFEHILLNIINNAKDAFDTLSENEDKKIDIYFKELDNVNVIKIIDNAGGIPENILNKIFNPYFTTKEEGKGTGIGLYMTKTIIEKHFKGIIEVDNLEDGAMFTISIPKIENDK